MYAFRRYEMHLQVSRSRRKGKIYEYARLVESYRNANGVPAVRIIANLGHLDAVALENLRTMLRASRDGKRVLSERDIPSSRPLRPAENLRYLDVAVLLELGRRFGLVGLLEQVMPRGEADVSPCDVVMALCLQRCVDAGSKLYAERWFPRTALPEILRIAPESFHNTRIHRVLDELDAASEVLMTRLPMLYASQGKVASAMYLDCTDTRFVGQGPKLAEVSMTKEGMFERKVGILLLCDSNGLPLRWKVLAGRTGETPAMHEMLATIRGLSWVGDAPIVTDRILGTGADIRKLLASGIRFVTASRTKEFETYAPELPHGLLENLNCPTTADEDQLQTCAREARHRIAAAGFDEERPSLWIRDLGKVQLGTVETIERGQSHDESHGARALRLIREIKERVDHGDSPTFQRAGQRLGVTRHLVRWYRPLLRLDEEIQREVLAGNFEHVSISQLLRVAAVSGVEAQRRALNDAALESPLTALAKPHQPHKFENEPEPSSVARCVRVVACFNPERFAEQRRSAQELLDDVQLAVVQLNQQLAHPNRGRTYQKVERAAERILERKNASGIFAMHISEDAENGQTRFQVRVELNMAKWRLRCRYHGFLLVLAHPDLQLSASRLAQLYRDKDQVEKDFQTIKSLIKLRPVWHHTDRKVRAHVTVCVLALLLERLLSDAVPKLTTGEALETLESCQLNRFNGQRASHYLVTEPTRKQQALLRTLRMAPLIDDDLISAQIQPRSVSFVSTPDQECG
jgi:hypothetical protein